MALRTGLLLLLALSLARPSGAVPTGIEVDPGPVGQVSNAIQTADFADLDGIPFDGRTLDLVFMFSDMKHVELEPRSFVSTSGTFVNLGLDKSPDGFFPPTADLGVAIGGAYLDENGDPVHPLGAGGSFQTSDSVFVGFAADDPSSGFVFHGIALELELPVDPTRSIDGARLLIRDVSTSPGNPFLPDYTTLTIGEWSAPEPASAPLLGLAASAGLALRARARRRSGPPR